MKLFLTIVGLDQMVKSMGWKMGGPRFIVRNNSTAYSKKNIQSNRHKFKSMRKHHSLISSVSMIWTPISQFTKPMPQFHENGNSIIVQIAKSSGITRVIIQMIMLPFGFRLRKLFLLIQRSDIYITDDEFRKVKRRQRGFWDIMWAL